MAGRVVGTVLPQHWARPLRAANRAVPWLLAGLVGLGSVASYQDWARPAVVASAVAGAAATFVARRSRWPLLVAAAVGWVAVGMWPAAVAASYYWAVGVRRRDHLVAYAAAASLVVAVPPLLALAAGSGRYPAFGVPDVAVLVLGLVVTPLLLGLWVAARHDVLDALRQRAEDAERERAVVADRERTQERARIAREMHDVLAHRVSLIVVQAGALEVTATDPDTVAAARLIRGIGREALADLRAVLGVLRSPAAEVSAAPLPGLADLDRLLDESRAVGMRVARRDEGSPRTWPAPVEAAAYRVVQEALTNAHRHAPAAPVTVRLRHLPDRLEVDVRNSPPAAPAGRDATPGAGLGLIGLRERVTLLGGELAAREVPGGGFEVVASLPAPGGQPG